MRKYLLAAVFFVLCPLTAYAALVNINTADATLLETLPGIGPSKASAIITYRTQHGLFATISDIQNVSGIGPSTYGQIESLITVGDDSSTTADSGGSDASSASTTEAAAPASSGAATWTPPPSALSVSISASRNALLEVPLHLSAQAQMKSGTADPSATITWSFGDGSAAEGTAVDKTYRYPGTYLVEAAATDGSTVGYATAVVVVGTAQVRIMSVSGDGVTLANDAAAGLDLSDWRLSAGSGSFRFPNGTVILPGSSVLFPNTITDLPVAFDATLAYPDGALAARSAPPAAPAQPPAPATSSQEKQATASAATNNLSAPAHEDEAVSAPTAATELAAVGAALPPADESDAPQAAPVLSPTKLLHSPWTMGFLGILALAGGAFMVF